jgi:SSS family solute:Na+ symporter
VVPQLFLKMFPDWFAGFCFAAIAIGALVPAAVMSIGAANTFTRNVWKPFIHPEMSPREESFIAKIMSLIVKVGALLVILFIPTKFAIDFQLLGGVWMIQCFPAIIFGLFTRWFSGWALLIGWAVGMFLGTYLSWGPTAWVPTYKVFELFAAYNGLTSVCVNILVSAVLSLALRSKAPDETVSADYEASRSALA